MRIKKIIPISLIFTSALFAQTLTLQESIDKTILNHPDIKSFMLKIKQAQKSYEVSTSEYLPQINLQANYNLQQTYALPVNGTFHTIDEDGSNIGVNLKQKICDFSKTSSTIKASKLEKDISKLSLKEAKALLVYKVKSLYNLMLVQKEAIKVHQQDLETKSAFYKQAKALTKQGLKTKADESRFLSALYIAEDNLAQARASYLKAKNTLSLYMAEEISDDVVLEEDILKREHQFENVVKEILKSNYQLKIEDLSIDKNRLLHKATKASGYGSIDAVASYNHLDTLNSYDSKLVGINLNIPLYSGGKISAQTQKAKIALQLAKEKKNFRILALKDDIEKLFIDIKRYDKTIKAKKAQLKSANETKNILEARYKEGLTTYIEVLDATTTVLSAKLGVIEAYYSKNESINRIQYLKGKTR
jgi:outer membrane protein TolC